MPRLFQIMKITMMIFFSDYAISGIIPLSFDECVEYCSNGVCNKNAAGEYKCVIISG